MSDVSSLRDRYTQFFVLIMSCAFVYMMVQSFSSGVANFQDNLYKKNILIGDANWLRHKIGDRILPAALYGKDGWVDYIGDENIDDFQNLTRLEDKKDILKRFTALDYYLKSRRITFLLVIVPNKATIYPDKLPEEIRYLQTQSRLDRLMSYLNDNNLPIMVDLRPALWAARHQQVVYYKENNTHWNAYGAFIAYTTVISALKNSHPELEPYKMTDLELIPSEPSAMPDFYFAPKTPFVHKLRLGLAYGRTQYAGNDIGYDQFSSIPDGTLPTLLMFHDSFGEYYLNDYLSMNFGRSHFIHVASSAQYLSRETIQQFKPDVVIIEIVERDLYRLATVLENFDPK